LSLPIQYLPYKDLRVISQDFLAKHHGKGSIPVPIEQIVEFDFGINIVPIQGLQRVYDIDAFISGDLESIYVDLGILESTSPYRYRFSLAHELSHAILHAAVFEQLKFKNIEEWKTTIAKLPEKERGLLEWQAYALGGLILVPQEPLKEKLTHGIRTAKENGFGEDWDPAKDYLCTWIGKYFDVSSGVIAKRLDAEKFWPPPKECL
jgi:Zn-dependent peptidase ImmA (M78 family)